ncbi:MAG: hypothetical protein U7M05_02625 [Candidatus Igneacidithiobacillus chanchocoensis]
MTDQELHLPDVFAALVAAQKAHDEGDMEELAAYIAEAGFSLCCALPGQYADQAPAAWFDCQGDGV